MNKVILIGNMTADAEVRTTTTGVPVATFTVAVNRNYTNASGERDVDFLRCVAFNKLAENIGKYTNKGSKVAVEGSIQTGSYEDKEGIKRYTTDIICQRVEFLTWRNEQKQEQFEETYGQQKQPQEEDDFYKQYGISEDDMPF